MSFNVTVSSNVCFQIAVPFFSFEGELHVGRDEAGFARACELPYFQVAGATYVTYDMPDYGWMEAEELPETVQTSVDVVATEDLVFTYDLPFFFFEDKLVINCDEHGFARACELPFVVASDVLYVTYDMEEWGWMEAVEIPYGCYTCKWFSGEACLPCTVNPVSFPEVCYDFEV